MNSILQKIAQFKRAEIENSKSTMPLEKLSFSSRDPRDFINALKQHSKPAVIAEIKKASPSKGVIREAFDVAEIAKAYEQNGASCLSVLTETQFFQGQIQHLITAKKSCTLPVLRKDFMIDPYQIYESAAIGADCILLIVAMLDDAQLLDFYQLARELQMAVLIESHNQEELERALKIPTPLIGINNRNLHTFHTDIQLSMTLKDFIPADRVTITESGINTQKDIQLLQEQGIHTFLIGECLMRASHPGLALKELIG